MTADALLVPKGATLFDRRAAKPAEVDIDPTTPCRRKDDPVIRPASDTRPMSNVLELQRFKRDRARFAAEPLTGFGALV